MSYYTISRSFPANSQKRLWLIQLLVTGLLLPTQYTDGNSDWLQRCSICHCNWNSGKKTADCKNKALSEIPENLSNELQVVDLANNVIPELRREEFKEANLQNLHKIFMRNCTIQEVNRDALKGLTILIELDISHNFIRELHPGTFNGLLKLRNLVMNHNEITVLSNYLFADLDFLSRVEFKNNRLKRIEIQAFGHLPMLSAVFFESNLLSVLLKETFSGTPKLLHLSLAQNPWNCTCVLQEFRDFVLANRLYTPPTDCAEPRYLKGKLWNEIPSENFACQPRILGSVRSFIEAQSDNITLPCHILGSPRPNITWVYNKRPINPNDHRLKILNSIKENSINHLNVLSSELKIYGVRASDKGTYMCIANNRGGKAEAEFHLLITSKNFNFLDDISGDVIGNSTSDSQSNALLVICLIATTLLLLLIIVILMICWDCKSFKTNKKDGTMMSENGFIASNIDKTHKSSIIEGSVIMEMQKSLLTEVNPVEKPPRRTEIEIVDFCGDSNEIKKTLLDESQIGNATQDDGTSSIALSDKTISRSRHAYVDNSYSISLPPDLLAFPTRLPPTSPSMQSSQSNIADHAILGIRFPSINSPTCTHMAPSGKYGNTTIGDHTSNRFMTLQHPRSRNFSHAASSNNCQQQKSFFTAPVAYMPTSAAFVKQSYMTIPRKPRIPMWEQCSSAAHSTETTDSQLPTSPNLCESSAATTSELQSEPVYDNLGLRTTVGGNSMLNLHRIYPEQTVRYTMRDRPLPATPNLTSPASNFVNNVQQQLYEKNPDTTMPTKIYEAIPLHGFVNHNKPLSMTSDTQKFYDTSQHHIGLTIIHNSVSVVESNMTAKIPPRPPPKPKKKFSVTTHSSHGIASQLFEDEGGTEV